MTKKVIFFFYLVVYTFFIYAQDESPDLIGTKAQAYELTDINGNVISSASTKGKIVVMNFWFIGCKPCLAEIPSLNAVYDEYADNPDVIFVSISIDEVERVKKKLKKYNINYPIVANGSQACKLFGVNGFPTNIVIDRAGKYYFRFTGGFSDIGKLVSKSIQEVLHSRR